MPTSQGIGPRGFRAGIPTAARRAAAIRAVYRRERPPGRRPFSYGGGDDPVVVTLLADVDQWFIGRDGQTLDPRRDDDVEAIADAIQASFRALDNEGEA